MSAAVYGFVSWLTASVVFIIYFFWAFVPDRVLHDMGISYFPSKYWALAVPTYLLLSVWITVFAYSAAFFYLAPPLDAPELIRDSYTKQQAKTDARFAIQNAHDLDLAAVNRLMLEPLISSSWVFSSSKRQMDKPIKEEKIFNLLMNARMRRTPNRKIRFLDFRESRDFQAEHISDFVNVPDSDAAGEFIDSLVRESGKFIVVAVPGKDAAVADSFRARPDVISVLSLVDFASFKKKFPILLSSHAFASAAFPTFAAEDVLYAGLFSFTNATISALGISAVVDMTPNGLEELPVSVSRHSEISSAAHAVAAALSEKQRVLIVDAQDGNLASLAAAAGLALHLRLDARTAVARVMAKTD